MTERESKEFYDDLRRKLENYGSTPPESVWAGIRQQVPNRRRRWWRGALLALLLVGTVVYLTVSTRPWRSGSENKPVAATNSASSTAPVGASGNGARGTTATTTTPAASPADIRSNQPPGPVAATVRAEQPVSTQANTTQLAVTRSKAGHTAVLGMEAKRRQARIRRQLLATDSTLETDSRSAEAGSTGVAPATLARKRRAFRGDAALAIAATRQRYPLRSKVIDSPSPAVVSTSSSSTARRVPESSNTSPLLGSPKAADGSVATAESAAPLAGQLLPLWVRLQLAAFPVPSPSSVAVADSQHSSVKAPKWAVQVVGGPTVSYRKLGANIRRVEQLERPATGYDAQLSVARTLTPRLSLAVGVGYTEVAAGLYLRLQKADSLPLVTTRLRDYYRLLTVPIEARYQLGNSTRWRYGVQAGAAPALLLSARTTEGGACNCQQQQWQPSDSTSRFRQLNLTLTAGAFVGYQAAPGLWLMLRPQAQYFLNSITDPTSGRAARHPWSVGVQGGISFDLPFKP